jgi:hypothetical protein
LPRDVDLAVGAVAERNCDVRPALAVDSLLLNEVEDRTAQEKGREALSGVRSAHNEDCRGQFWALQALFTGVSCLSAGNAGLSTGAQARLWTPGRQTMQSEVNQRISGVTRHLLLLNEARREDVAVALGISKKTLDRRLRGVGDDWSAPEVAVLASYFKAPVALFYEGPEALLAGVNKRAITSPSFGVSSLAAAA